MITFSKLSIPGCEQVLSEMQAISDTISKVDGRKIQISDKIAELQRDVQNARNEQTTADKRGDRKAWESAFDRVGSLLREIDTLKIELAGIKPRGLKERYESLRQKIYALEASAEEEMKAAKQKVEDYKPLRGYLAHLLEQSR